MQLITENDVITFFYHCQAQKKSNKELWLIFSLTVSALTTSWIVESSCTQSRSIDTHTDASIESIHTQIKNMDT